MAFWLSGILALSLFVRGFSFTSVPPELFGDEVDVGYQAYSLFKTGRDLYAQAFPTYIHSLSEWRAPLLMYATVPTVAAFGTSELGVRLPQVIFGSFALTFYTYSTAVIFTPLWLLALLLLTRKKPNLLALLLFTITITPFIFNLISGRAQARFGLVSIFTSQEVIDKITNFRQYPSVWETVFHNKPESYFSLFFSNYLRAFSPEFLFVRGDPAVRHNMQYIGQLLLLTPPLAVAVGIGISQVVNLKSPILNILLLLLFTLHFSQVAHYYLVHYPTVSWRWWHVGYKSAMREIPR